METDRILKHIQLTKSDQDKLDKIKEEIGAINESNALRAALRAYRVKQ